MEGEIRFFKAKEAKERKMKKTANGGRVILLCCPFVYLLKSDHTHPLAIFRACQSLTTQWHN